MDKSIKASVWSENVQTGAKKNKRDKSQEIGISGHLKIRVAR